MIKDCDHIELGGIPIFTTIRIQTPTDESLPLPADACYTYITEADGQILSEDGQMKATAGKVILSLCGLTLGNILANQPHGHLSSVIVHFNPELLEVVFEGRSPQFWKELEEPVTEYVVQEEANNLIKSYFDGLIQLFQNKKALTDTLLKVKLQEIVLLLLQSGNAPNIRAIMRSLFSRKVFSFKQLVDAHIERGATVENLAMLTNSSVSTFKRKFREVYGTTPGRYVQDIRLGRVAHLLKNTDEAISGIGYECGFSSPEHLSRAFKKKFDQTPTEYRLNFSIKQMKV